MDEVKIEEKDEKKYEKKFKRAKIISEILCVFLVAGICINIFLVLLVIESDNEPVKRMASKPILYFYPEEEMNLNVTLEKSDNLTVSYPFYNEEWNIKAFPDGTLIDNKTGKELYSLYYECLTDAKINKDEGFVVKGEDTAEFLDEKLKTLGLNYKEREEFIIYWLPRLESNKYNYIKFLSKEEIEDIMPIEFSIKPDSFIRVFMAFKPIDEEIKVKEQKLETPQRRGFTVVEWGAEEIR